MLTFLFSLYISILLKFSKIWIYAVLNYKILCIGELGQRDSLLAHILYLVLLAFPSRSEPQDTQKNRGEVRGLELEEDKNRTLARQLEKLHVAGSSLNLAK